MLSNREIAGAPSTSNAEACVACYLLVGVVMVRAHDARARFTRAECGGAYASSQLASRSPGM
jgi:ribosomal protein S26